MLTIYGGYDYDFYVYCKVCKTDILREHGELTLDELLQIEADHEHVRQP